MKFKLLLICCISACYSLGAQAYLPFQFGDTKWHYNEINLLGSRSYNYFSLDSTTYFFGGTAHYKIEKQFTQSFTSGAGGFYLRNDSSNKRVYIFNVPANTDYLLYDFGASIGDTINGIFNQPNILDTVVVDSIQNSSVNGVLRKHIFIHSIDLPTQARVWIEGIGSTYELLYPSVLITDPSYDLACQVYDTTRNYGTQFSCSEWFASVGVNDIKKSSIQVYPNPATSTLFIKANELSVGDYTIKIFNLQSKVITKEDRRIDGDFSIGVSDYTNGVYFLSMQSKNGFLFYSKFLKQ